MSDLSSVKIGDKLFVQGVSYVPGYITTVARVTPTGRVITKHGEFNPNGYKRGEKGVLGRHRARPATEDDIAGIYRAGLVSRLERFRLWDKLSADDLKAVAGIVAKYEAKERGA